MSNTAWLLIAAVLAGAALALVLYRRRQARREQEERIARLRAEAASRPPLPPPATVIPLPPRPAPEEPTPDLHFGQSISVDGVRYTPAEFIKMITVHQKDNADLYTDWERRFMKDMAKMARAREEFTENMLAKIAQIYAERVVDKDYTLTNAARRDATDQ